MAHKKHKISVAPHHRRPPTRKPPAPPAAPMPGPHEFSAEDEQAMRQGQRAARGVPDTDAEPDAGDPNEASEIE
jgi:hypothetical protein